jgi:hypothetical protein
MNRGLTRGESAPAATTSAPRWTAVRSAGRPSKKVQTEPLPGVHIVTELRPLCVRVPQVRRRLFTFSAVLLLLCVAVCVLWVRSYRYTDSLAWPWSARRHAQLHSARGGFAYMDMASSTPRQWFSGFKSMYIKPKDRDRPMAGTGFAGFRTYHGSQVRFWMVPYWFIVGATAVWPILRLLQARRAQRRSFSGLCPQCGYDLRATPDRCPECGTATVAA